MLNKMRIDGKQTKYLFLFALTGLFGFEYFYLNMKKMGWIKLGISWIGATIVSLVWIIYGSITLPADFNFNLAILLPSLIGGAFMIAVFAWSLWNCVKILMGTFKDEKNNNVSSWNSSKEDFAKWLVQL